MAEAKGAGAMHAGLLILRIGIGLMFLGHGVPKLLGGPETWTGLGRSMEHLGLGFAPTFWGFMAAFSEAVGGAALLLGFLTRIFSALLLITMGVASIYKMQNAIGAAKEAGEAVPGLFAQIMAASHPLELGVVFLALLISGAGAFSLDAALFGKRPKEKW